MGWVTGSLLLQLESWFWRGPAICDALRSLECRIHRSQSRIAPLEPPERTGRQGQINLAQPGTPQGGRGSLPPKAGGLPGWGRCSRKGPGQVPPLRPPHLFCYFTALPPAVQGPSCSQMTKGA